MRPVLFAFAASLVVTAPPALAAETAGQTAQEHGHRIIALMDKGDRKALQAYLQANYSPGAGQPLPRAMAQISRIYQLTRGAKFDGDGPVEAQAATVYYRSPITGGQQAFKVMVEDKAPFRVTGVASFPPAQPLKIFDAKAPLPQKMKALDAFVGKLAKADGFSGVVLIAQDDKILLNKAYGMAERSFGAPNRLDTKFNLGSMDKMFTTAAIARLVEQGKLSWDDPLSKFMPDFPDAASAQKIKLKHLASHTSGLGNYFNEAFEKTPPGQFRTVADYLKVAADGKGLSFEPGTNWDYSNTGMLALGRVIEVVTGQDYYDYMRQTMFSPLGMTGTDFYADDAVTPNLAQSYETTWTDDGLDTRNVVHELPARGGPAGGGYATAPDLLRFSQAWRAGKVVSPTTAALMTSPKPELGSTHYGYGFNLNRFTPPGLDAFGHGGDSPGACASFDMTRNAGADYTVIVLANSSQGTCHGVARFALSAVAPKPAGT